MNFPESKPAARSFDYPPVTICVSDVKDVKTEFAAFDSDNEVGLEVSYNKGLIM